MEAQFKTVSFGGYDKKAVDTYIAQMEADYEKEIASLKANATKLSDTVKNLHTMREVNMNESKGTIDNLKSVNEKLQVEIDNLKSELESYKSKEMESATRYESISRTLLQARESADALSQKTNAECEAKRMQTEIECQQIRDEAVSFSEELKASTTEECERLTAETKSACQELKETTFANCDNLKRQTREETDALTEETETKCRNMVAETTAQCDAMKSAARVEVYNARMTVKRECESISDFVAQLMVSVDNVSKACIETKEFTDSAFGDLSSQAE